MKLSHLWPIVGFVVPTLFIGFVFVIPNSCIAGINELTLGFVATVVAACVTYWFGLRSALRNGGR